MVQARRLPQIRAAAAGGAGLLGVAAAVAAVAPVPEEAVQLAVGFEVVLLMIAGYEMYRRTTDRRLLQARYPHASGGS